MGGIHEQFAADISEGRIKLANFCHLWLKANTYSPQRKKLMLNPLREKSWKLVLFDRYWLQREKSGWNRSFSSTRQLVQLFNSLESWFAGSNYKHKHTNVHAQIAYYWYSWSTVLCFTVTFILSSGCDDKKCSKWECVLYSSSHWDYKSCLCYNLGRKKGFRQREWKLYEEKLCRSTNQGKSDVWAPMSQFTALGKDYWPQ